jgi:uncharacterized protein YbaR (Trm112 family)
MKYEKCYCPICKNKLKIKCVGKLDFNIPLSKANNEIWCSKCQRWIKFDIGKGGENGKDKEN